jgi:hypothetical protein
MKGIGMRGTLMFTREQAGEEIPRKGRQMGESIKAKPILAST